MLKEKAFDKYTTTDEFKKNLHDEKLFATNSNFFSRKRHPIPDEIDGEVNKYMYQNLKIPGGPEVFVCVRYIYSKIFSEEEMISPIISPVKSTGKICKEVETLTKKVHMEIENMEKKL